MTDNALQCGLCPGRVVVVTERFGGTVCEFLGTITRSDWSVVIVRKWGSEARYPYPIADVRLAASEAAA